MPQTSVENPEIGVEGQLSADGQKDCYPVLSAEASAEIPFGRMLAKGTDQDEAKLTSALTDKMVGVSVFGQAYAHDTELGDDGFKPGTSFDVLRKGRIYVRAEDAVTPQSQVHVRMIAGQGGAALTIDDTVFTAEADTELFTAADHGMETGDGPIQVANAGGALPAGLVAATNYWIVKVSADTFKLATTRALALAGTTLAITTDGTGTQTLSDTATTERVVVSGAAGAFRGTPDGSPLVFADAVFTAANATEIFTSAAHGLQTGDGPFQVSNAGGALPAGLAAATDYWVIRIDANTFYLATSRALALAGTHLLITSDGTGVQTMSDTVYTERLGTMNISKFARWRSSADIGEIAELEVNMTLSDLAYLG